MPTRRAPARAHVAPRRRPDKYRKRLADGKGRAPQGRPRGTRDGDGGGRGVGGGASKSHTGRRRPVTDRDTGIGTCMNNGDVVMIGMGMGKQTEAED